MPHGGIATSCKRSEQIDLAAFLVEPRANQWGAFRAHYPTCPECSAELAIWSELEGVLRSPGRPSHPAEAALLAFETDPSALSVQQRTSLGLHLDSCAVCRDALAAVRALDLETAAEATAASTGADDVDEGWQLRLLGSLRETLGFRPQPPLSLALVAAGLMLVAIPLGLAIWSRAGSETSTASQDSAPATDLLAGEQAPLEVPAPAPEEKIARAPSDEVPARDEPTPVPETPVAHAPVVEPSKRPALESAGEPEASVEMIVASLMPESPLVYMPPSGLVDAGPGRFPQGRRSAARAPTPLALAPDHVGLTVSGSPTLYWLIPARAHHRIEFVLAAPDAIDPVLMVTMKAPVEMGVHAMPLGDHGVTLEPDVTYRWSIALVLDEDQRHKDVIGGGAIARIRPTQTLLAELERAGPGAAGHTYAANGLWYDALQFVSQSILRAQASLESLDESEPGRGFVAGSHPVQPELLRNAVDSLRSRRAELLEQTGLQTAADYDRQAIGTE